MEMVKEAPNSIGQRLILASLSLAPSTLARPLPPPYFPTSAKHQRACETELPAGVVCSEDY